MEQFLSPKLDDLKLECVLVQAWKKTSKYIRQHNWYGDTLELDFQSLRLPTLINEIQLRLQNSRHWNPTPLRVVPAPKSQKWKIGQDNKWIPSKHINNIDEKIRPLAHVSIVDQVVATAVMLCMADHIETLQGDPTLCIELATNRNKIISYGNRLFCDTSEGILRHRWGSGKLYREYFADYQTFLKRPENVVNDLTKRIEKGQEIAIVQSDLSKFYDRVTPSLLIEKIIKFCPDGQDQEAWIEFLRQFFAWSWHDKKWATKYAKSNGIEDFSQVALPQGLVASGFFANIVLMEFDEVLKKSIEKETLRGSGIILQDICRYVDDMRFVLTVPSKTTEKDIEKTVTQWLNNLLHQHASGMIIEENKTKAIVEKRDERFKVPQSKAAARIQHDVSGTFDMLHGTELIGAIEGFFSTQQRYSQENDGMTERAGLLVGKSDLRDGTATRFAAGKFRRVFRSLRPMLDSEGIIAPASIEDEESDSGYVPPKLILSQKQLDERARLFAAMLIEEWVSNPSNVRLLRIALDFYPDCQYLEKILIQLRDSWHLGGCKARRKEIKQYCLSELFRAGATETGMVSDEDCLPFGIKIDEYHKQLTKEAKNILAAFSSRPFSGNRFSWYLMQQVYLYLISRNEIHDIRLPLRRGQYMLSLYQNFIGFLQGEHQHNVERRCIFTVLAVSAFGNEGILEHSRLSEEFLRILTFTAPSVAHKLWKTVEKSANNNLQDVARRLGLKKRIPKDNETILPEIASQLPNPFWDETNLLELANWAVNHLDDIASPWQIVCQTVNQSNQTKHSISEISIISFKIGHERFIASDMFDVPKWVQNKDRANLYRLGQILRFALCGNIASFRGQRQVFRKQPFLRYAVPISHWEQFQYGEYQGRTAFAPEWIPLSSWVEDLLFKLLSWPGCHIPGLQLSFDQIVEMIKARCEKLSNLRGNASGLLFLEQLAPFTCRNTEHQRKRLLRVGVVQSVIPDIDAFKDGGIDLSDPLFRRRHRKHLVALIEGVEQMLIVRETHMKGSRTDK